MKMYLSLVRFAPFLHKMVPLPRWRLTCSAAAKASLHEWVNVGGLKPFIVVVLYECSCNTTPFTEVFVELVGVWVESKFIKQLCTSWNQ